MCIILLSYYLIPSYSYLSDHFSIGESTKIIIFDTSIIIVLETCLFYILYSLIESFYKQFKMKNNILETKNLQARKQKLELIKSIQDDDNFTNEEKKMLLESYTDKNTQINNN